MVKFSKKLTLLTLIATPVGPAVAEPSFYAIATGGYGLVDTYEVDEARSKFSGALYGSIGAGIYATSNIRFQAEGFYYESSIDSFELDRFNLTIKPEGGDISGRGMSFNAQYEFLSKAKIRPFIGFGTGFVSIEIDDISTTVQGVNIRLRGEETTDFILQADLGVSYYPIPEISIAPAYRYISIGGVSEDELSSDLHVFTLRGAFHF